MFGGLMSGTAAQLSNKYLPILMALGNMPTGASDRPRTAMDYLNPMMQGYMFGMSMRNNPKKADDDESKKVFMSGLSRAPGMHDAFVNNGMSARQAAQLFLGGI